MAIFDRFKKDQPPRPGSQRPPPAPTEKISVTSTSGSTATSPPPNAAAETLYSGSSRVVGVLVAVEGKLENEVYRVFDGPNQIGRGSRCQIVLASQRVSREHALVTHSGGAFRIQALNERNPTLVNGQPTAGGPLEDGDSIGVGDVTLKFRVV